MYITAWASAGKLGGMDWAPVTYEATSKHRLGALVDPGRVSAAADRSHI